LQCPSHDRIHNQLSTITQAREERVKDATEIIDKHYHALLPLYVCTGYLSCTLIRECKGFYQLCIFKMRILFEVLKIRVTREKKERQENNQQ